MNFSHSAKVRELQQRVSAFVEKFVYPAEGRFQDAVARNRSGGSPWLATEVVEDLKREARAAQLFEFIDVRVPAEHLLLGEGRGFESAPARRGPRRIHHCMRLIGLAERAHEMSSQRAVERVAFGRRLSEQGVTLERITESRIKIDQAWWLVLNAAYMMDTVGNRAAKKESAMIKVAHGLPCAPSDHSRARRRQPGLPARSGLCRFTGPETRRRPGRGTLRADRPARAVPVPA